MNNMHRPLASAVYALCLAGPFAMNPAANAGDDSIVMMAPMRAHSLDLGAKHVLSYFLDGSGLCRLTVMISDAGDESHLLASRVQIAVENGQSARIDTAEGEALALACDNGAQAMRMTRTDGFKAPAGAPQP